MALFFRRVSLSDGSDSDSSSASSPLRHEQPPPLLKTNNQVPLSHETTVVLFNIFSLSGGLFFFLIPHAWEVCGCALDLGKLEKKNLIM